LKPLISGAFLLSLRCPRIGFTALYLATSSFGNGRCPSKTVSIWMTLA
jgi:hypothetical protein